ncbi:MAG: NADH-quinone oxidoreductase subunit E [Candidatus Fluviicola riflensis]|nr:MAG: NAD(P)H-dependent oxidoreductase subunit E [Candidatus Fluviicola riflensis]OGS78460.1 MAG: NADH-quinone oxidoreductase subunit E [Candidatus Fluviicola riflensis]OGS85526.1 MAG: NADH-quinone oxidoreductase subunit E [Fluviicola sp. RIFCSPHIGHO2_01_FULL_43_53]OGS87567.1 MAG: NADH-quinone oxidoreductase subunit E [Fluviicola sp. RIFCSPHIGHO2_12_FULL_43_24]
MSIKITNGNAADEVAPQFSAERMVEVQRIINQYPEGKHKSALMRILHMAEEDFGGWLSVPTMNYVAGILNIQPIEVYEVATFYTMFNIEKPGKVVLEVCRTGPCMLVGSDNIIDHLKQKLGVEVGGTSADGMFTLKTAECLGACGYGPMLQCGKHYHEHLTIEKVDALLETFRKEHSTSSNN